jgi:hypothetical protein
MDGTYPAMFRAGQPLSAGGPCPGEAPRASQLRCSRMLAAWIGIAKPLTDSTYASGAEVKSS